MQPRGHLPGPHRTGNMTSFQLDEEQCERVRDCLQKAGSVLKAPDFERFIRRIEASIDRFLGTEPTLSYRELHDALRSLWRLAHASDSQIGLIRARISKLPKRVMDYIESRARQIVPRLEASRTERQRAAFLPPSSSPPRRRRPISAASIAADEWQNRGGFRVWALKAPPDLLVEVVVAVTAEGVRMARGRSRGSGRREVPKLEPVIFGVARGASGAKPRGGRPPASATKSLVMHLAYDWTVCTGRMPEAGRSDHGGFGDLAHSVFQWIGISPGADHTLRVFWSKVEAVQSPPLADCASGDDSEEDF